MKLEMSSPSSLSPILGQGGISLFGLEWVGNFISINFFNILYLNVLCFDHTKSLQSNFMQFLYFPCSYNQRFADDP